MRSVKANASKPLMKGRKNFFSDGVKTGVYSKPREECRRKRRRLASAGLQAADVAPGLKAARARIRLRHGTLEPVAPMRRERPKRGNREAESTERRCVGAHLDERNVRLRSTGTERLVVAMKDW